jgi:SSS family transporter
MALGWLDGCVLAAYLVGTVALGLWMGRHQRSAADYMLGERNVPWWLILFSIVATETSTVTFLSIPGFAWQQDFTWLQLPLGFVIGRVAVVVLLLPQYFKGEYFTAYELLQSRFGGATKQAASLLFIVTRSLADGLRLFLTAIVLQEAVHMPLAWAVVVMGLTTVVYTYVGGMKAVLWTDLVQFVVYMAGAVAALWMLVGLLPGGLPQLFSMGAAAGKFHTFDLALNLHDPYVLWAGVVGGAFLTLGSHGADQLMVQRYLCARRLPDAQRALLASGLVILLQFALFLLIGVGLWAFFTLHPPAVPFDRPDRVFVRFMVEQLPPGLLGLVLGAVFAAAMSTLSSSLNSLATTTVNDLCQPLVRGSSPARVLRLTRWLTGAFGLVQIGVGIAGQGLTTAGFTTGITLGLFFLGLFADRVGQRAALTAFVLGLAGMTVVYFTTPLAWPWYSLFGSLGTFALGLLGSLVWPREPRPAVAQ